MLDILRRVFIGPLFGPSWTVAVSNWPTARRPAPEPKEVRTVVAPSPSILDTLVTDAVVNGWKLNCGPASFIDKEGGDRTWVQQVWR